MRLGCLVRAQSVAMTLRTSLRATAIRASTSGALAAPSSEAQTGSNGDRPNGASASNKRARYIPPPPTSLLDSNVHIKADPDQDAGPSSSSVTLSPGRYSLRKRTLSTQADDKPADVKQEAVEIAIKTEDSASTTPRKVKKEQDLFATSPRKTNVKPIKIDLDASEARPAPKRWREQYDVLIKQRKRIIAPVDTLGCEENGKEEKRKDQAQLQESPEAKARRERFTCLISLMLSSQTKDPVTAEAVHNLQRNLPGGLCLESILAASQDDISSNINKVGFWRRKTGYIQSAAKIILSDFGGEIPKTIDDLCSLPGVGPKMGFLCLQSAWGLNIGIGVDVHVHRVSNRLKWVKSTDPEGTRLQLQSWLPKELHRSINKTLVGFGQVICQPVGPRCDLCALGAAKLCPSYRRVDPKSIASRVKIELLPEDAVVETDDGRKDIAAAAIVKVDGPEGAGEILVKEEDEGELAATAPVQVKTEDRLDW